MNAYAAETAAIEAQASRIASIRHDIEALREVPMAIDQPVFDGSATEQDFRIVARLLYPEVPEDAVAEQLADQRVRDAADEMLETLKFIYEHIADPERGPRDLYPAFGLNASRAVEQTRAAIAKAEGRQ